MRVKRGVSSSSGQVLPLLPRNVLTGLWVSESLSQTKVDQIDIRRLLVSNEEIVRFDVSVEVVVSLDMLYSFKALYGDH